MLMNWKHVFEVAIFTFIYEGDSPTQTIYAVPPSLNKVILHLNDYKICLYSTLFLNNC